MASGSHSQNQQEQRQQEETESICQFIRHQVYADVDLGVRVLGAPQSKPTQSNYQAILDRFLRLSGGMRLIVDDVHMASGHLQEHFRQAGSAQDFYFPQREPKAAATLSPGHPPASLGIFGLSHEELLQSEWVVNDTHRLHSSSFLWFVFRTTGCPVFSKQLTGGMQESVSNVIVIEDCQVIGVESLLAASDKYQIKRLRLWCPAKFSEEINASQVCDILSSDMHALLEEGNCSDVQFMVQEEVIHVIVIEDCEFVTFKAFLQFLYTDRRTV
ncbi:hypothetical protein AK812_SmicGene34179 [Symbiodinium microadriaticum]|uniref:BTB domain-containing protein n=1 Tax=Symbiodinium microadriaticum TaxID=2951 RepID=A0A1Q9CPQ5_SYMMI|nr:hypothetical protein AK812_SmicGene34179 [Symbiodinium microadriaticum]